MTVQSRAFGISLAVHAGVFALILSFGTIHPRSKAVVLDFSLSSSPNAGLQQAAAAAKKQSVESQQRKTVTPSVKDEEAVPIVKELTEEAVKPVSEQSKAAKVEGTETDTGASSSGSAEEAKDRYLGAHFIYIRDRIFRNLSYPPLARKMGWQGRVTVAFTVCSDGSVEDISIVESSGFAVLDRGAIEAIRRSCPLPRPAMKTAPIMPVVYRLE